MDNDLKPSDLQPVLDAFARCWGLVAVSYTNGEMTSMAISRGETVVAQGIFPNEVADEAVFAMASSWPTILGFIPSTLQH